MSSTDFASVSTTLVKIRDRLTRYRSHVDFLSSCIKHDVIPKGMTVGFGKAALPTSDSDSDSDLYVATSRNLALTQRVGCAVKIK